MQDNLENKLTMYKAVAALLDANTTKTAAMAAFTTAHNSLKDYIDAISEKNILKGSAAAGKTDFKNQQQAELIAAAIPIAGALFALGSALKDPRIQATGDLKKGDFLKLRDTELTDVVTNIKNNADAHAADLAAYGVIPADIAALDTKINSYSNSIGSKESSQSVKVGAGKVLPQIFNEADALLKDQLDRMMEKFASSDQQFYQEYKSARVIKDLGHRFDEGDDDPTPPPSDPTPPNNQ